MMICNRLLFQTLFSLAVLTSTTLASSKRKSPRFVFDPQVSARCPVFFSEAEIMKAIADPSAAKVPHLGALKAAAKNPYMDMFGSWYVQTISLYKYEVKQVKQLKKVHFVTVPEQPFYHHGMLVALSPLEDPKDSKCHQFALEKLDYGVTFTNLHSRMKAAKKEEGFQVFDPVPTNNPVTLLQLMCRVLHLMGKDKLQGYRPSNNCQDFTSVVFMVLGLEAPDTQKDMVCELVRENKSFDTVVGGLINGAITMRNTKFIKYLLPRCAGQIMPDAAAAHPVTPTGSGSTTSSLSTANGPVAAATGSGAGSATSSLSTPNGPSTPK